MRKIFHISSSTTEVGKKRRLWACLLLIFVWSAGSWAQESSSFDDLPSIRNLAASIADPDSRHDTLMTLLAVARLQSRVPQLQAGSLESAIELFVRERSWLEDIGARYISIPSRSSVLDPTAWLIMRELEQHKLEAVQLVSPLGADFSSVLEQLFDRSDPGLAAAMLPEALFRVEAKSILIWQSLLVHAGNNPNVLALISGLNAEWFDAWMAAEAPSLSGDVTAPLEQAMTSLQVLAGSTINAGPPDDLRLKRLRFELLMATATLDDQQVAEATRLLHLATAVDGLRENRYLAFAEVLLWTVSDLLASVSIFDLATDPANQLIDPNSVPDSDTDGASDQSEEILSVNREIDDQAAEIALAVALADLIPRLSSSFARQFSEVEPRINTSMAAAYDVVQMIQSGTLNADRKFALTEELADAITQLTLLMPKLDFYTEQPIRRLLAEEIDICISIAADQDVNGDYTLSREQFDACQESMVNLADSRAREAELAGDTDGPFGMDQLRRELPLTPSQRINYLLGYIGKEFSSTCGVTEALPNPLEWSVLATLMTWLAERSPVYFQTPENEAHLVNMRMVGEALQQSLSQQADCLAGTGAGLGDAVSRSLDVYRESLQALVGGIREAELAFRVERLQDGADVVLTRDSSQHTGYRKENLLIGPCDPENICEMGNEIEATRALVGLFPDEFLIAEQTGMGELEICYDKMAWVDRRSSSVRIEDDNVADYHGRLSFELYGRFHEQGQSQDVFGSRFVSPEEYHYLFAAATEEILTDECPVEWVGSRVVTRMPDTGGFKVVPSRLTYLAAVRSRPSQVVSSNWSIGAQWRDWFVTGIGVQAIELEADDTIGDRVNQHLRDLYQAEQASLYQALLTPAVQRQARAEVTLNNLLVEVGTYKALMRSMLLLFYPDTYRDSEDVRAAMEGTSGLLDTSVLRRFRDTNTAIELVSDIGLARVDRFQAEWDKLPEAVRRSGSVSSSVAYAMMRLNTIYKRFFAVPVSVEEPSDPLEQSDSETEAITTSAASP